MKNKLYYTFQVYEKEAFTPSGQLFYVDSTAIEVIADDHESALKKLPAILPKGDERKIKLVSIVERDLENKK